MQFLICPTTRSGTSRVSFLSSRALGSSAYSPVQLSGRRRLPHHYPHFLPTQVKIKAPLAGFVGSRHARLLSSGKENDDHINILTTSTSTSTSTSTVHAFDRNLKRLQRDNAARGHKQRRQRQDDNNLVSYDYFREEIAKRLVDRLDDIHREEGFPLALDIGAGAGFVHRAICADDAVQEGGGGIGGVQKLVQLDSSREMLYRDAITKGQGGEEPSSVFEGSHRCDQYRMVADEEAHLPFPDGTFDLVISSGNFHWINNLPSLFLEASRVLKPDGCFMFSMVGNTSLPELRASLVLAEMERDGGVGPHVGPFVQLSDVGSLLQRAGFALPTLDVDTVKVSFPNAGVLMEHLQRMGENNACIKRRKRVSLDVFLAASCLYDEMFPLEGSHDGDGEIEASVQVIYAIGWTPHESQQQPKKRGSALHKLGEARPISPQ